MQMPHLPHVCDWPGVEASGWIGMWLDWDVADEKQFLLHLGLIWWPVLFLMANECIAY